MDVLNAAPASDPELSVVVPLLNEEESVGALMAALDRSLTELRATLLRCGETGQWPRLAKFDQRIRCEIILVDDGSLDGTFEKAVAAAATTEIPVRIISLQRNFGQTAAMQAGIDAASGNLIATLDGDLQNDPADLARMIEHLEANKLDLLVGRRKNRQDGMFLRLIPSWIANRLIAKVTGVKISDYGCSLKIYRSSVIKQVRLLGEMHRFIPAWVALVTHPSRIGEIDVHHRARQFGSSKYGLSRTIRVVLDLLSVLFFMRFRARPGHFFGTVGLVVGALGAAMLGSLVVSKYGFGQDIGTRPMLMVGALAMFSSIQFICFGVMAEMLSRVYYDSTSHPTYVTREVYASGDSEAAASTSGSAQGRAASMAG